MIDFTREQTKEMLMREIELKHEIAEIKEALTEDREIFLQGAKCLEALIKEENPHSIDISNFKPTGFHWCANVEATVKECCLLQERQEELAGLQVLLRTVRSRK